MKYYQPTPMHMSPCNEQSELRNILDTDYHAHDAGASPSDCDYESSDYPTYGLSSHDMGSPAAFSALVSPAPAASILWMRVPAST
jgi:hypothetical protein